MNKKEKKEKQLIIILYVVWGLRIILSWLENPCMFLWIISVSGNVDWARCGERRGWSFHFWKVEKTKERDFSYVTQWFSNFSLRVQGSDLPHVMNWFCMSLNFRKLVMTNLTLKKKKKTYSISRWLLGYVFPRKYFLIF